IDHGPPALIATRQRSSKRVGKQANGGEGEYGAKHGAEPIECHSPSDPEQCTAGKRQRRRRNSKRRREPVHGDERELGTGDSTKAHDECVEMSPIVEAEQPELPRSERAERNKGDNQVRVSALQCDSRDTLPCRSR